MKIIFGDACHLRFYDFKIGSYKAHFHFRYLPLDDSVLWRRYDSEILTWRSRRWRY